MARLHHRTVREGMLIGALGAGGVAVWFLLIDTVAGRPLFTPAALGAALFGTLEPGREVEIDPWVVTGYTLFHLLAFMVVGVLATWATHMAEREPVLLALFPVLFIVFEMGFYGWIAVLDQTELLQELTWYQVGGGNLVAALLMGVTLWRLHPSLAANLDHVLSH